MDTLDSSLVDTDVSNVNPFGDMLVTTNVVTSCVAYNCTNRQKTGSGVFFHICESQLYNI